MRWFIILAVPACAELPPLPEVESEVDWSCRDGFEEAIDDCDAKDCPGLLCLTSLMDNESMSFATERTIGSLVEDSGFLDTLEIVGITPYFRSQIQFSHMDVDLDRPVTSMIVDPPSRHGNGTHFEWTAWNTSESVSATGDMGIVGVFPREHGVSATFLVSTMAPNVQFMEGCAYVPRRVSD